MQWRRQKTAAAAGGAFEEVARAVETIVGSPGTGTKSQVRPDSLLGSDLGMSSIAVARLVGLLQKGRGQPLPFHKLLVREDGSMPGDIRVSDVAAFLEKHLTEKE